MASETPSRSLVRRYPKLVLILANLVILWAVFAYFEHVLKDYGMIPGYVGANPGEYLHLQRVDSLIVEQTFFTDSIGIFHADPQAYEGHTEIKINANGFRGRLHVPDSSEKKSVLFIGDSFVWGGTAKPISQCFVDLVDSAGYHTWNAGIPGTEPNQYARLGEELIPNLKPDHVVVAFYLGNDIMFRKQELKPYENKYHITNAGWLNAFLDGDYIPSAQETYTYYFKRYTIPNLETDAFNRFCAQYVVTTLFWKAVNLVRKDWDPVVAARKAKLEEIESDEPVSYDYLAELKAICEQEGSAFHLVVVPLHDQPDPDIEAELFKELPYSIPTDLLLSDYHPWPDGHFNNEGHRKFAKFTLDQLAGSSD